MKMCEEYAALLDMYVDGFCTEEEAARVRAHLAECEDCRMYVAQILQMKEAFPDAEETEVPEGFAQGVMAAIRAQAAPRKKTMKSWQKTLVQMAACVALVIALGPISEMVAGGGRGAAAPEAAMDMMSMAKADYSGYAAATTQTDAVDAIAEAPVAYDMESGPAAPAGGATMPAAPAQAAQYAREMKVRLTEKQRLKLFSDYVGTASSDGSFTYVLTAAEFDAVLAKLPAESVVPGSELTNGVGTHCRLTVYPAE